MWFLLKIGSFSLNVSTHWKIDFDTPGTSAAALANYKCRCTISWTTHILLSCITPGLWTWTQRCNLNSILCINYLQVNVLSFTLVCVYYHHDLIQGANSQVKDALDPALNRVGQELGWDVFLVGLFVVCLCFYFALANSKSRAFSFSHERLCRLSMEEEDREEPMVSDADHHEDFQVTHSLHHRKWKWCWESESDGRTYSLRIVKVHPCLFEQHPRSQ